MARDLNKAERDQLEALMDACGTDSVLMTMSEICGLKADHVRSNWQDERLAKRWATLEGRLGVIVGNEAAGL